jgi:DNA primase
MKQDAVAEIKARISIEDVVSEYVQLKRAGRNFKGLSPFTSEKSPSFVVSPEKQIWHDFSSGRGGDVFSFIQVVEGLDFKSSLEILARKAGVDLSEYQVKSSTSSGPSKERLFAAVEHAVGFYQKCLLKSRPALEYLRQKRGYEKQTLLDFRFGFSPDGGKELLKFLSAKGFSCDELKRAGLINQRGSDYFDMFRGRIMIPLLDPQGRPVGFTARQLVDSKDSPKYINTQSTLLYDKSRQVFGLSQAKEAIRKSGFVVVVEGNLDVVASHQAGVKNVVASAGTALTSYHLKSLQRFTADVRLSFDEDRAGQEAAQRAIPLAQTLGIELSMITIPSGKDPDELIKQDTKAWTNIVSKNQYMVDWLIDRLAANQDMSSAQGKRLFTEQIATIIRQLKDPVEQEHYARVIAERTNTGFETIFDKLKHSPETTRRLKSVKTPQITESTYDKERRVLEQHLLALSMHTKEIGKMLENLPLDVFSDLARTAASYIQAHPGVSPTGDEYVKMLALLFEEQYQSVPEEELTYQAQGLLGRLVNTYAKLKKQSLAVELAQADEKKQKTLLTAVRNLDELVVQFSRKIEAK